MSDTPTLPPEVHYAASALGWRFHPLEARGKKPLLTSWPSAASKDLQKLEQWSRQFPGCNWGVVTGEAFFVVDIDGQLGRDTVAQWEAQGYILPPTLTVSTGRDEGGEHRYYQVRSGMALGNRAALAPGIDIKGLNGYVVAAGSVHPTGKRYVVRDPLALAEAPLLLLESIVKAAKPDAAAPPDPPPDPAHVLPTEREQAYAQQALRDEVATLSSVPPNQGLRNKALNNAALHMGEMVAAGWISEEAVIAALWEAAATNGYRAKDGDDEARGSLLSGLKAGKTKPRAPLPKNANSKTQIPIDDIPLANDLDEVELVDMSTLTAKAINWHWLGYIPRGKLILLAGAGGTGKSTLAFHFAAVISSGGFWPDGSRCTPGVVLIFTTEDDSEDTIVPRLEAMGADMRNIRLVKGTNTIKGKAAFNPATDMPKLERTVARYGKPALLIIDPIVSAVTGDMNKTNDVRTGLNAVVEFAAKFDCAALGISHFAKGTAGRNPAERVIGSQAFSAFARVVLVAAKEEDSEQRVFTRAKSNIGEDAGGYHYIIQPIPHPRGFITTRIVWTGAITGSSRDILSTV